MRSAVGAMLDFAFSPQGNVHVYAEGRTVPTVSEQAPALAVPVLVLQGEQDASTPLRSGRALASALRAAALQAAVLTAAR